MQLCFQSHQSLCISSVEPIAQLLQAAHGHWRLVGWHGPINAAAVEPHRAQSRVVRTQSVELRIIAHVQHGAGRQLQAINRLRKDARIWLGIASAHNVKAVLKEMPNANAMHIGIAIGDRHDRPARC